MKKKEANILAKQLARKSHFVTREVGQILGLYSEYCEEGVLTRRGFKELIQNIFKLTDKLTLDRIFHIFDSDSNGFVSQENFVANLSVILKGTIEEQIQYCFSIYDLSGDGFIAKEEMITLMGDCFRSTVEEEENEGVKVIS